ncbi:Phage DNA packaging protein Nu1 [Caballeronia fortuita]|uniref:Phage DNA packaging protein Nu1 n=1 Tax=Caballeronia fortuita TaxID=1777138 RepID=A0A158E8I1_9BURK|nr:terminase small subunit [Caballeronia fortuita]SAL03158.1 Phage DNA packaging protein Nu1 [Caballeronia fortuita]
MQTPAKGTTVNRAGLADVFGVALTTIDTWVRSGCPVVQKGGRGQEWKFNTAAVARWREETAAAAAAGDAPDDIEKLDLRKAAAETQMAELKLAQARAEVAPVAEFEKATARLMATIRANITNVPARAVLRLLGEKDSATFKRILKEELTLALEQSAEADLALDDDEDGENDE